MKTEAAKRAARKYLQSQTEFKVRVSVEKGERIKKHVASKGLSLNAYIVGLIDTDMVNNGKPSAL